MFFWAIWSIGGACSRVQLISIADPAFWTRFGVHYGLFLGALRSQATSNQLCTYSIWKLLGDLC
jgi:acyl-CoA oxidase